MVLLYLNRGEWGIGGKTDEQAGAIRTAEAIKACEILKARPVFAGHLDGRPEVTPASYEAYRKLLEAEQPDILFTHWPVDAHKDHRATASLAYETWQHMGCKFPLYYYEVSTGEDTFHFTPRVCLDITEVEPRKRAACFAHASQNPEKFYALQQQISRFRAVEWGRRGHVEAFVRDARSPETGMTD